MATYHGRLTATTTAKNARYQYHATAAELTLTLFHHFGELPPVAPADWDGAWRRCLSDFLNAEQRQLAEPFVEWLCSHTVKSQVAGWIGDVPRKRDELAKALATHNPRPHSGCEGSSIADAARKLFVTLAASKSSSEVLLSKDGNMPGGSLPTVVFGRCDPSGVGSASAPHGLFAQRTTDAILSVFNSPFGPDVLVTTDALSEGVDLHGCCRHLVHYELNPSPLSAIQRNGRLRRIDCWAARCRQPLRIGWPRFTGTRDERLVRIVRQRLEQFGLLLGGISAPVDPDASDEAERARTTTLNRAKDRLRRLSLAPDANLNGQ